jgi:hypothetical protein
MTPERIQNLQALQSLMNALQGQYKADNTQLTLLFNLNNYFFPQNKEHGKGCGSCRQRVYQRMLGFINGQGKEELSTLNN